MSLLGHLDSIILRDLFADPEVATNGDHREPHEPAATHLLADNEPEDASARPTWEPPPPGWRRGLSPGH